MNYVPVRIKTLNPMIPMVFDLFIKLNKKYLLYVRGGDELIQERIDQLIEKGVKQLFISDDAENSYQEYVDHLLVEAATAPDMSPAARAGIVNGIAESSVDEFQADPTNEKVFADLIKAAEGLSAVIGKRKDVLAPCMQMVRSGESDIHLKHVLNVASIVCCLVKHLKMAEADCRSLCIASLLFDIGITKIDPKFHKLFIIPFDEFSDKDWEIYKKHPELGREVLSENKRVPADVINLVQNHEELKSGDGFPSGEAPITQNIMILGLCTSYDRRVTCLNMSHSDAIDDLETNESNNFDQELIDSFKKMMKEQGLTS